MDCLVGAATGAFKGVSLRDSSFVNILPVQSLNPKQDEVTALAFALPDQSEILVAQLDRQLRLYDSLSGNISTLFSASSSSDTEVDRIRGLHVTPSQRIVTACESGAVRVWEKNGTKLSEAGVPSQLLTMDVNRGDGRVAVGGRNSPLRTLDPESLKETWTSKNVRADFLQLTVPVWDIQTKFLRDDNTLITTTGTHEIRIYDPRAQRRPVKTMEWLEEPITALSLSPVHEKNIIVANTKGEMAGVDLRKMLMYGKYKGQTGSIRCIQAHESAPLVASCGIDRFLRVHDIRTKKIVSKVYCKARLNTLLLKNALSILNPVKEEANDEDDWGNLKEKTEDEKGDIASDSDEESEGPDVWDVLEKSDNEDGHKEEKEEDGAAEEEDAQPPSKKSRSDKEVKNRGKSPKKPAKANARKRMESGGEHETNPEPVKKSKASKQSTKRKPLVEKEVTVLKKRRK